MFAEQHPVIAHEDDHRVVVDTQAFKLMGHIADHIVDLRDQPVIVFNVVLVLLGSLEPGTPAIAGLARSRKNSGNRFQYSSPPTAGSGISTSA